MRVSRRSFAMLSVLAAACGSALPQRLPWQPEDAKPTPAVRYLFPEQVTIAAGKASTVELHFRVADGLHINSHVPLQKSLIRTELAVVEPHGVQFAGVDFPAGSDFALKALPSEKLSVYQGEFVLHAHISAAPGEHLVEAALRYQACTADTCYPPKTAPVAIDVVAR